MNKLCDLFLKIFSAEFITNIHKKCCTVLITVIVITIVLNAYFEMTVFAQQPSSTTSTGTKTDPRMEFDQFNSSKNNTHARIWKK